MVTTQSKNKALNGALKALSMDYSVVVIPPDKKFPTIEWAHFRDNPPTEAQVRKWFEDEPNSNYAILTDPLVVLDVDVHTEDANGINTLRELASGHEKISTPVVKTPSGGFHYYFFPPAEIEVRNSASKVGAGLDIRAVGGLVVGAGSKINGKRYEWIDGHSIDDLIIATVPDWLLEHIVKETPKPTSTISQVGKVKEGGRDNDLVRYIGSLLNTAGGYEPLLAAARARNQHHNDPPLDDSVVLEKVNRAWASWERNVPITMAPPERLADAAYHGIMGKVVKALEPLTEADNAALLLHTLIYCGAAIGRSPHIMADGARHGCNLFGMVIGATSKARKGSAQKRVESIMFLADPSISGRKRSGLSTAEGFIQQVSDGYLVGDDIVGEVVDKRLIVIESEVSSLIKKMNAKDSTLSDIIRVAWDGDDLHRLTKREPLHASNPHIAIVGHSSEEELRELVTDVSIANGFLNRFLIVYSHRSKLMPHGGGDIPDAQKESLFLELSERIAEAKNLEELAWDDEGYRAWELTYEALSEERGGFVGYALNRGEAQVLRLSLLYAVMDGSQVIKAAHLRAALAVWEYVEESTSYIFKDKLGNKLAEQILRQIKTKSPLTKTDIHNALGRNHKVENINIAIETLLKRNLISFSIDEGVEWFYEK